MTHPMQLLLVGPVRALSQARCPMSCAHLQMIDFLRLHLYYLMTLVSIIQMIVSRMLLIGQVCVLPRGVARLRLITRMHVWKTDGAGVQTFKLDMGVGPLAISSLKRTALQQLSHT